MGLASHIYQNRHAIEAWKYISPNAADNSTGLANLVDRMVATGRTVTPLEAGTYSYASPFVCDRQAFLHFQGCGSNQDGTGASTTFLYTGAGSASANSFRLCAGVELEGIKISWNNPGFTGYLVDFGPTQQGDATRDCALTKCNLWSGSDAIAGNVAALLFLGSTYGFRCTRSLFHGGNYNVLCRFNSYDFNNDNLFIGCKFSFATTAGVRGAQHTSFFGGRSEPLASGAAGFYLSDPTLITEGVLFHGLWIGDDNPATGGAWFILGADSLVHIHGGLVGCNTTTAGVRFNANASQCVDIKTVFKGNGGSSTAVDFGATTGHASFQCVSAYPGITNRSSGTIPDGSLHNFGGSLTLNSPLLTGNVSAPGLTTLTTAQLNISGAPLQPNMLTSDTCDFEGNTVGTWQSNLHATLTASTAAAKHGTHCLSMLHNTNATDLAYAAGTYGASPGFAGLVPVQAGQTWYGKGSFLCAGGGTPRLLQLDVYFTPALNLTSTTKISSTGSTQRDNTSTWTPLQTPGALMTQNGYAFVLATISDTAGNPIPLGEVHYGDCFELSQNPSSVVQFPADANQTVTLTPSGAQSTGELNISSGGTAAVNVNTLPGAGTGGVNLKTPVTQV